MGLAPHHLSDTVEAVLYPGHVCLPENTDSLVFTDD